MRVFDEKTKADIKAAIKEAEINSSCEVVAIATQRSGEYLVYALFVAAVTALTLPQVAYIFGILEPLDVIKMQIIVFMLFVMSAYLPQINVLLTPKKTKERCAKVLAQSGFFRAGLHGTTHKRSLMLFVSFDEKYVDILTDAQITRKIHLSKFEPLKIKLMHAIGSAEFAEIYISVIKECGAILAKEFPPEDNEANELGDELIEFNE